MNAFQTKFFTTMFFGLILSVFFLFCFTQTAQAVDPTVNITYPETGSSNNGSSVIYFVSTSDLSPTTAECSIDNFVTFVECTTGVTTLAAIPGFSAKAEGSFTFSVRDDVLGHIIITDSETGVIKDTTAPTGAVSSPRAGDYIGTQFPFTYSLSGNAYSATLSLTRTGGSPDAATHTTLLTRDDISNGSHTIPLSMLQSYFGNTLVNGTTYSLNFVSVDEAGNSAAPIVITGLTTDLFAPEMPARTHIQSNNIFNQSHAKKGDTVTVTALVEEGTRANGTIGGKPATSMSVVGDEAMISRVLDGTEGEWEMFTFSLSVSDGAGNISVASTNTTDDSVMYVDFTPPETLFANPAAGSYTGTQSVSLSSSGSSSIRYTIDGSVPSCTVGAPYEGSISLSSSKTIKAIGCDTPGNTSPLGTFVFTITSSSSGSSGGGSSGGGVSISVPSTPTVSPSAGTYTGTQIISFLSWGSTSIRYTLDGSTPTCTSGSLYTGAISLSATKTVNVRGCNAAGGSSVSSFLFTIKPAATSGTSAPVLSPQPGTVLPKTPVTNTNNTVQTPVVANKTSVVFILDPAQYEKLLSTFGLKSDGVNFEKNKEFIRADAKTFGVIMTADQEKAISNFVTYGASTETIKLGAGERRALIRDYFETVGRADVVWDDVQRLTIGQKPVKRNLAKEQAQVTQALRLFQKMVGHAPNFQNASEDLAWNTLMYRIRFTRDLKKEQQGILQFQALFARAPKSPADWAAVRALGYVLK